VKNTIFVAIGAYNEPELELTISNCLKMAEFPERIHFGVAAHYHNMSFPNLGFENAKVIKIKYPGMLGLGFSRLAANSLYDNEDYYLQIDGHSLFERNWDTKLLNSYKVLEKEFEKPIISNYVPWWSVNEDSSINFYNPDQENHPAVIKHNQEILGDYPYQDSYDVDWSNKEYIEHFNIAGHFIFSKPQILEDLIPDYRIVYAGEEFLFALRAWTRGYRMFAIPNPIVWHKNKHHGFLHPKDRMFGSQNEKTHNHFVVRNEYSAKLTREILTGKYVGYWGSPSLELLQQYEKAANIDYKDFYRRVDKNV
jgi:hypothetical protein